MYTRKAKALQHGVSFVGAVEVVDRSLSLIVEHLKCDESARPRSSSAHSTNRGKRHSKARVSCDSDDAPMGDTPQSSASASPDATDFCDYPGKCLLNVL